MSLSALPALGPTVAKAPIHVPHPQQGSPTPNQQALFSLLRKRHERYLAMSQKPKRALHDPNGSVHSLTTLQLRTDASNMKPHHLHLNAHTSLHMVAEHGISEAHCCDHLCNIRAGVSLVSLQDYADTPSCSDGNQRWPGNLECSELAQQVVQRAKGRLRKRQKRSVRSLNGITKLSRIGSDFNLHSQQHTQSETVTLQPRTTFEPVSANVSTVQNAIRKHKELLKVYLAGSMRSSHVVTRERIHRRDAQRSSNSRTDGQTSATFDGDNCSQQSEAKLKVIYLSDRHSVTPKSTGIPNAPPATPSSAYSQSLKYVPSLNDIKSQRLLRNRLHEMATELNPHQHSQQAAMAAREAERQQREAVAKMKTKQRAEIYALNRIMTEYEEEKFQAYLSAKV